RHLAAVPPGTGRRQDPHRTVYPARQMIRAAVWAVLGTAIVLATRAIAYALAPQSLTLLRLDHKAGGPHLAALLAVAVAVAALAAGAVLGLAALAVRGRLQLEPCQVLSSPRLSLRRLALRAALLFAATSLAFAYFESYLHWRAGLGWHGINCLVGPVHRDA